MLSSKRKYILCFGLVMLMALSHNVCAQNFKIKDYEEKIKNNPNAVFPHLMKFYAEDTTDFILNYIIAKISEDRAKAIDPRSNLPMIAYYYAIASRHYKKTIIDLRTRDVKKNEEYLAGLPIYNEKQKPDDERYKQYIEEKLNAIDSIIRQAHEINLSYNACVNQYNACNRTYIQLLNKYYLIKDLLIKADRSDIRAIENLQSQFDSVLQNFEQYRILVEKSPMYSWSQVLIKRPIDIYRFEGITNTDFLAKNVRIWNYGEWAQKVKTTLQHNIHEIRMKIDSTYNALESEYADLALKHSEDVQQEFIPKDLFPRINKYDNSKIMNRFFTSLKYRNAYYRAIRYKNLDYEQSKSDTFTVKRFDLARSFYEIVRAKGIYEAELLKLNNEINASSLENHRFFFEKYFASLNGFRNYPEAQLNVSNKLASEAFKNYHAYIVDGFTYPLFKNDYLNWNQKLIPNFIKRDYTLFFPNQYYTSDIFKSGDAQFIYTGNYTDKKNRSNVFVAQVDSSAISWLFAFDQKMKPNDHDAYITSTFFTDDNVIASYFATRKINDSTLSCKSYLANINNMGKYIEHFDLSIPKVPRTLYYDEINEQAVCAFYGETIDVSKKHGDTAIVVGYDLSGKEMWNVPFFLNGDIVDIVKSNNQYLLFINYKKLKCFQQNIDSIVHENYAAAILFISPQGEIKQLVDLNQDTDYFIVEVQKINSENISLVGFKQAPLFITLDNYKYLADLKYILLHNDGRIRYTN